MSEVDLDFFAVWEPFTVWLHRDEPIPGREYTCSHVRDGKVPRIIVAQNEGGHNSTGICLDCLLAALRAIGEEI